MAARHDFIIEKKSKFYKEFELDLATNEPESLVDYTIKCVIKESPDTDTVLFELTEANGGVVVLDDPSGKFAITIAADETDVDADFGYYDILKIDSNYVGEEDVRLLQGRITFDKGIT